MIIYHILNLKHEWEGFLSIALHFKIHKPTQNVLKVHECLDIMLQDMRCCAVCSYTDKLYNRSLKPSVHPQDFTIGLSALC